MSLRSVQRFGNNSAPRFSMKKVPGSGIILSLPLAAMLAACGSSPPVQTTSPSGPPTSDQRADALLAQMTQAQKLQMVAGGVASDPNLNYSFPRGAAGWIPGIPQLSIPALYCADGSVGVGNGIGPATALPSSIASAAGWDAQAAVQYGTVIGTELSDYGINGCRSHFPPACRSCHGRRSPRRRTVPRLLT